MRVTSDTQSVQKWLSIAVVLSVLLVTAGCTSAPPSDREDIARTQKIEHLVSHLDAP